jgi:putative selenate reductase
VAELVPAPIGRLARRLVREWEREGKAFDLNRSRVWSGSEALDLGVGVHGRWAATPLGPAAGPHGQMAQNVLLSYLAGSRVIELKTVQVRDDLRIPRPCIDAPNIAFNVEWSQELRLAESLREYVTASMLIEIAEAAGITGGAPGERLFEVSLGYDLAGIGSAAMRSWIDGIKDCRGHVDAARQELVGDLRRFRDLEFRSELSRQVTLSTFHGCPAREIESIVRLLMEEMGLDVTVKLNPMLLGRARVDALLRDLLGYAELETRSEDFDRDLRWDDALALIDRSGERARAAGRSFGVKLSNTLVVRNHRKVLPATEEVMYLSGQPLHVLTLSLLADLRRARLEVPVSFSAGVDAANFSDCVSLGLAPVTVCTDLLRPGGYGRLSRYLGNLEAAMRSAGAASIEEFIVVAQGRGDDAVRAVVGDEDLAGTLCGALSGGAANLRRALAGAGAEALHPRIVAAAAALNTERVAQRVLGEPRYRALRNRSTPKKIGRRLWEFDCLSCDKCIWVCPNDALFVYECAPFSAEAPRIRVVSGETVQEPGPTLEVRERKQIGCFHDFCNSCGNCDTFCPEDGGPHLKKPGFFGSREGWERMKGTDGFYAESTAEGAVAFARLRGAEYRLKVDRTSGLDRFEGCGVAVEVVHGERRVVRSWVLPGAPEGQIMDVMAYLHTVTAVEGALDPRRANPVNAEVP